MSKPKPKRTTKDFHGMQVYLRRETLDDASYFVVYESEARAIEASDDGDVIYFAVMETHGIVRKVVE